MRTFTKPGRWQSPVLSAWSRGDGGGGRSGEAAGTGFLPAGDQQPGHEEREAGGEDVDGQGEVEAGGAPGDPGRGGEKSGAVEEVRPKAREAAEREQRGGEAEGGEAGDDGGVLMEANRGEDGEREAHDIAGGREDRRAEEVGGEEEREEEGLGDLDGPGGAAAGQQSGEGEEQELSRGEREEAAAPPEREGEGREGRPGEAHAGVGVHPAERGARLGGRVPGDTEADEDVDDRGGGEKGDAPEGGALAEAEPCGEIEGRRREGRDGEEETRLLGSGGRSVASWTTVLPSRLSGEAEKSRARTTQTSVTSRAVKGRDAFLSATTATAIASGVPRKRYVGIWWTCRLSRKCVATLMSGSASRRRERARAWPGVMWRGSAAVTVKSRERAGMTAARATRAQARRR